MTSLNDIAVFGFSLLVPPRCVACGCEPRDSRAVLCPDCEPRIRPLGSGICGRCALPLPCAPCPAQDAGWESAGAAVLHGPEASSLVVAFKQSGARRLADRMAAKITAAESMPDSASAVLIPVPMDPRRKRQTGVDHALLLARAVSRQLGRPVLQPLRRRSAPRGVRQAGAARRERLQERRIQIEPLGAVPRDCLVLDDVHTTGATLRAVTEALVQGGAERVRCMTFARALPPAYAGKAAASW